MGKFNVLIDRGYVVFETPKGTEMSRYPIASDEKTGELFIPLIVLLAMKNLQESDMEIGDIISIPPDFKLN